MNEGKVKPKLPLPLTRLLITSSLNLSGRLDDTLETDSERYIIPFPLESNPISFLSSVSSFLPNNLLGRFLSLRMSLPYKLQVKESTCEL